jgi:hypothetical protein
VSAGTVNWPPEAPLWRFLWEIADYDSEGIAFRDVSFRGKKVFHKASLPMIRVKYDSGDGPYKDPLSGANMRIFKIYEGTNPAFRFLVVESYHRIGRYHLTNRWIFRSDGIILPQLYSAGLQHPSSHQHHVYWRFDFDILGASSNLALRHYASSGTNWGYGPGWYPITYEATHYKHGADNLWAVINKQNFVGFTIQSGLFDGWPDSTFSAFDVWIAAYHGDEDKRGALGTRRDDQLWMHINGENVDGKDVVVWYCAHLQHHVHDSGDEWHVCGPILRPFGY